MMLASATLKICTVVGTAPVGSTAFVDIIASSPGFSGSAASGAVFRSWHVVSLPDAGEMNVAAMR
jgi:hypothetical protein